MNLVDKISSELALREPQRLSLLALDGIINDIRLGRDSTQEIEAKVMRGGKFDTEFPSFTFALATGIGKTRLMGAMIAYLYHKKKIRNFFILTPSETIYSKTIRNFKEGDEKYVLKGLTDLPPFNLITGENYTYSNFGNKLFDDTRFNIYVFNIQKIFNERKDVDFRFHKYQENLGSSFAELLQKMDDLVVLMDESHRYRAPASLKAIHHLNPLLGLEFTATPNAIPNVIYSYTLANAIKDAHEALLKIEAGQPPEGGYIKIPYVVTRRDDYAYKGELEDNKLLDGVARHRAKKAHLVTYFKNTGQQPFEPVTLITTKSIDHSKEVYQKVTSDSFFGGYYKDKTLLVHSKSEEQDIQQLVHLEAPYPKNKNEIVIHVDKLKEGWDVKNIFTIIPFRASVSKTLIEQTIGRGLRLPFGELTGVEELDTLEIVSHENYQRVLDIAHQVATGLGVKQTEPTPREELQSFEILPKDDSKLIIQIPQIETKATTSFQLKPFAIGMNREEFKKIQTELIRTDVLTKEEESLAAVEKKLDVDPVNYLVRLIIRENPEFEVQRDKKVLQKIVGAYLRQISAKDTKTLERLVATHTQLMLEDILEQLQDKIADQTKIKYTVLGSLVQFGRWARTLKASARRIPKDRVSDSDIKDNVITGYKKSIYGEYVFDSKQEKYLADAADKDKDVIRWVKLPLRQLTLTYKYGRYNPDFIVEKRDVIYIIEVKKKKDVTDKEVQAKAQEAKRWAEKIHKVTGKKWEYKLIPHDDIQAQNTLGAIISTAWKVKV